MKSENSKKELINAYVDRKNILESKFSKNEPCPCGSGNKFKSCCFSKHYKDPQFDNVKGKTFFNHYISKLTSESNLRFCIHPNHYECNGDIIKAHSIANKRFFDRLAVDGHVMAISRGLSGIDIHPVSRNAASTFTGFCKYHDDIVFKDIDTKGYDNSDLQSFLYAYRAFSYVYHTKLCAFRSLQNLAQKNPGLNHEPDFVDCYRSYQKGINTANFYREIFDKYVTEKRYDLLTTIIFELNQSHELAVSSAITLDYDLDGNIINDYSQDDAIFGTRKLIFVSIFPEDEKTIILLSWLKDFEGVFNGYKKQLVELSQIKLMIYFNNFIPAYIENFFFSKRLFEKQTRYSQNKIAKAFKADFRNNCLDLRDEDDLRYLDYDNFKKKRMLEKTKYDLFK